MTCCKDEFKPSFESIKSSLRNRAIEYPGVAALHGLSYAVDSARPKSERICWFICTVSSFAAALVIIAILLQRFHTDPMSNSLEIMLDDSPLILPKIYLCPPFKSNKKPSNGTIIYENIYNFDYRKSMEIDIDKKFFNNFEDKLSPNQYYNRYYTDCDNFIKNSTLNGIKLNCSNFEKVFTTGGHCFLLPSFNIKITNLEINFSFNITSFPTRVYVTPRDEEEFIRHLPYHKFILPTSVTMKFEETITSPDAKILMINQRNCFFPGEKIPYIECSIKCEIENCMRHCGCLPWYFLKFQSKNKSKIKKGKGINKSRECSMKGYKCLLKYSNSITDASKCRCKKSCDDVVFGKKQPELRNSNEPCEILLSSRSKIKYKRNVRFGFIDLLISFGGIAGLFLGFSLLSAIEFGYYFTLRSYCATVLRAKRNNFLILNKINVGDKENIKNFSNKIINDNIYDKKYHFYDYVN